MQQKTWRKIGKTVFFVPVPLDYVGFFSWVVLLAIRFVRCIFTQRNAWRLTAPLRPEVTKLWT